MSFSVSVVGSVEGIKKRLSEESARLTDASKQEFDAIKPALETLLDQQVSRDDQPKAAFQLDASGHAYFENGVKKYGRASVVLKEIGVLAE